VAEGGSDRGELLPIMETEVVSPESAGSRACLVQPCRPIGFVILLEISSRESSLLRPGFTMTAVGLGGWDQDRRPQAGWGDRLHRGAHPAVIAGHCGFQRLVPWCAPAGLPLDPILLPVNGIGGYSCCLPFPLNLPCSPGPRRISHTDVLNRTE